MGRLAAVPAVSPMRYLPCSQREITPLSYLPSSFQVIFTVEQFLLQNEINYFLHINMQLH
jgi:hypothetical protein